MARQQGSVHVIVISVFVIVLVAAVGFLFWQNVLNKEKETVSDASVNTTSDTKAKTELKTHCAKAEKICFDYPQDWSTTDTERTVQDIDGESDYVTVLDNDGSKMLDMVTGLDGIGGSCGQEGGSYKEIIETHATSIRGDYLVPAGSEEFSLPTVYAVIAVGYTDGQDPGWTVIMGLYNAKNVSDAGKIGSCDLGLGTFPGRNALELNDGTHGLIRFLRTDETSYKTKDEAKAVLATSEAKKAYEVLRSAHYE